MIELLLIIGMLAILAALVLPALSRASAAAKRVLCINNQRQLALAWTYYTDDHAQRLVSNGQNDPPNTCRPEWVQLGPLYAPAYNCRPELLLNPDYALFATYVQTLPIYFCPADRPIAEDGSFERFKRFRSYSLNCYLGYEWDVDLRLAPSFDAFRVFSKLGQICAPADTFLFQDVNPDSICWPFFGVYMDQANADAFFNFPNSSHNRGGVISFTDGHVAYHRWGDARTIQPSSPDYHFHHDLSPNNADLQYLRDHATIAQ